MTASVIENSNENSIHYSEMYAAYVTLVCKKDLFPPAVTNCTVQGYLVIKTW